MSNYWIDTHAHIYASEFDNDRNEAIERFRASEGKRIFMPNVDHRSIDAMLEVEFRWPDVCTAMIGLHPCSVKKDFEKELYIVEDWLRKRKFAGIGEIGTDLYWDKSFWLQQQEAFRIQLEWAKEYNLPVVIHCRESIDETIKLVQEQKDERLRGIFHCFSGNLEQAKKITDLGFLLGIGGVSTFKNGGLDQVLPHLSMEHIVIETDCPYLAPVPHRGKRNEPSYITLVAERVAKLLAVPVDQVQRETTQTALKLFGQKS